MKKKTVKKVTTVACGILSLCCIGAGVGINVREAKASDAFTVSMKEGASLRIGEVDGQNGLTYTVTMPKAEYTTLMANVGENKTYKSVEFGVLIAPYSYHQAKALNDEANVFGASASYDWAEWTVGEGGKYEWVYKGSKVRIMNFTADAMYLEEETDTYYSFAGSIVNILDGKDGGTNNLTNEFYGVGYVKTTLNEGDTVDYVFTEDNKNNVSAAYIAQRALEDTESTLTSTEKQWLQDNYVAKAPASASTTSYTVESYFENASGEYVLDATKTTTVTDQTAEETVTATPNTYDGYALNEEKSVLTGKVYYNGKRAFKAYYDRGYENTTAVLVNKADGATYDLTTMLTEEEKTFVQGKENVTYKLTDSKGEEKYNDANSTVTLSTLANGVYTLEILSGTRTLYTATQVDICDSNTFEFLDETIDFVDNFEKMGPNTNLTTLSKATDAELEAIGMTGDVLKLTNTKASMYARAQFANLKHTDAYYTTYFGERTLQFEFWMKQDGSVLNDGTTLRTTYRGNTYGTNVDVTAETVTHFETALKNVFTENANKEVFWVWQGDQNCAGEIYQGNWRLAKELYEETAVTLLDKKELSENSVAFTSLMSETGAAHMEGATDVTYTLTYKNTNTKVNDYTASTLDVSALNGIYLLTAKEGEQQIYSGTVDIFHSDTFEFFDEQVDFLKRFASTGTSSAWNVQWEKVSAEETPDNTVFSGDVLKVYYNSNGLYRRRIKLTNLKHTDECYTTSFAEHTLTYDLYLYAPDDTSSTRTGNTYGSNKTINLSTKTEMTVTMAVLFATSEEDPYNKELFWVYSGETQAGANYYGNFRIN